jgi:hypothetical protein
MVGATPAVVPSAGRGNARLGSAGTLRPTGQVAVAACSGVPNRSGRITRSDWGDRMAEKPLAAGLATPGFQHSPARMQSKSGSFPTIGPVVYELWRI